MLNIYVCKFIQRPKVNTVSHPLSLFDLICPGRISQSNPELASLESLAGQFPLKIPCC